MKKLLFSVLFLLTIVLTACSSASTGTPLNSTSADLSIETQLVIGTLKLAGTDQDISAEQAEDLILYWQVYKELGESDTVAQAEVDGLVAQIQETMTADQMQAIAAMQITQQDVFTSMQGATTVSSGSESSTVSLPSSENMPAGGPPADGGEAPMGGGMPADMSGGAPASSTDQTESMSANASLTKVPSALVDAVIQALQERISA
ncbi:MAG: hypothetical protein ACXW4Q_03160 [Anaerolineales bacterium]